MHDAGADIIDIFVNLNDIQADIFGIVETKLHCRSQTVQNDTKLQTSSMETCQGVHEQ
jgi:hypothetical protein